MAFVPIGALGVQGPQTPTGKTNTPPAQPAAALPGEVQIAPGQYADVQPNIVRVPNTGQGEQPPNLGGNPPMPLLPTRFSGTPFSGSTPQWPQAAVTQSPYAAGTVPSGASPDPKKKNTGGGGTNNNPPSGIVNPPTVDDAFTAGLGMFFAQYLAPMMTQINAQNTGLINQWGNTMNQMLSTPQMAGVKAIMQPYIAGNMQNLGLINMAAADQVLGEIPFNTMMNQIGSEAQALNTATTVAPTALAQGYITAGGAPAGIQQALAPYLNTPEGQIWNAILSGQSGLASLTNPSGKTTSKSSSTNPSTVGSAGPNPYVSAPIVQQAQNPAAGAGTAIDNQMATNLANMYANTAAAQMAANQAVGGGGATANAIAGAGYNPYNPTAG